MGAHRRWCEEVVGRSAAKLGQYAERLESMGDSVGEPEAANVMWHAAGQVRSMALAARLEWREETGRE